MPVKVENVVSVSVEMTCDWTITVVAAVCVATIVDVVKAVPVMVVVTGAIENFDEQKARAGAYVDKGRKRL